MLSQKTAVCKLPCRTTVYHQPCAVIGSYLRFKLRWYYCPIVAKLSRRYVYVWRRLQEIRFTAELKVQE
jgi:hypothetical protein